MTPNPAPIDPERPAPLDGGGERHADLHEQLRGPAFDSLRRFGARDFVLRVPHLGIEIRGVDAAISWLQRAHPRLTLRPGNVAALGPFAVYVDDADEPEDDAFGHGEATMDGPRCHVLELDGDHLVSWCLVASTIEHRLDRLRPATGTIGG